MAIIPEGYGLIAGRSRENAKAAIEAATEAGFDSSVVRTVEEGYVLPVKALDLHAAKLGEAEKKPAKSKKSDEAPAEPEKKRRSRKAEADTDEAPAASDDK